MCRQPFDIADLSGCEVLLLDFSDQVQIDHITQCRVFIGMMKKDVFKNISHEFIKVI